MCVGGGGFTVNVSYKQEWEGLNGFIPIILFISIVTEMKMRSTGNSSTINGAIALL